MILFRKIVSPMSLPWYVAALVRDYQFESTVSLEINIQAVQTGPTRTIILISVSMSLAITIPYVVIDLGTARSKSVWCY